MFQPDPGKWPHQIGVQQTPDGNPSEIKENGNEFDAYGNKAQINNPGWETLLVEDATSDKEPRVDFHNHTCTHAPPIIWLKIWNHNVKHSGQVMLNNGRRAFDGRRDQNDP